jgi:SAM-dependent methyltransferase
MRATDLRFKGDAVSHAVDYAVAEQPRSRGSNYRGVLQILRFNWPWYAASGCVAFLLFVAASFAAGPLRWCLVAGAAMTISWSVISLLASHWVYDRSRLTKWTWITDEILAPERGVNIHAGFDETTTALRQLFPNCQMETWDCFRPDIMTEKSIARARRESHVEAAPVDFENLPAASASLDCAFLIFAAHEIRTERGRDAFFGELHRILKPGGCVLLVEHLRDVANFVAYGPGCWHFLLGKEWLRLAAGSKLSVAKHFRITPLVNVYLLRKGK